jgi:hypothetical protein
MKKLFYLLMTLFCLSNVNAQQTGKWEYLLTENR